MSAADFQPRGGVGLVVADGLARVTIRRGDRFNALSQESLIGLRDAARALRTETAAHAVIVHGDPVFTAGADLKDPAMQTRNALTLLEKREALRLGPDMCDAWAALDQVTIAAIEGFCIGGGVALAAACDFRVMARSSYMRLPEVPLGMNMSWHTIPRLVTLCGPARTKYLTLFGERLGAAEALAQGLADQVSEDGAALAAAGALRRRLASARLGVVGEHPVGMDSCHLDETSLASLFGIQISRIPLEQVFERAKTIPQANLAETRGGLDQRLDNLASLDQAPLNGTLSVYHALKAITAEQKLDGLAVLCWPEFFTVMGCAACGAMSMLSDGFGLPGPLPCSCEADINGTVTQLMLQTLAGTAAFGTDMVGVDVENDRVALWHCGLAPLSMADPTAQPHGEIHSNRKVPLVFDFPLKPGVVTLARLSQATGALRLVYGRGQMMAEPKPFSGTAGVLKLDCGARTFLDLLMREGLEHHVSLTYGDFAEALQAFANLIQIPALKMERMEVN